MILSTLTVPAWSVTQNARRDSPAPAGRIATASKTGLLARDPPQLIGPPFPAPADHVSSVRQAVADR
jgi:hypothetical protein